jgi:hypothetical protein
MNQRGEALLGRAAEGDLQQPGISTFLRRGGRSSLLEGFLGPLPTPGKLSLQQLAECRVDPPRDRDAPDVSSESVEQRLRRRPFVQIQKVGDAVEDQKLQVREAQPAESDLGQEKGGASRQDLSRSVACVESAIGPQGRDTGTQTARAHRSLNREGDRFRSIARWRQDEGLEAAAGRTDLQGRERVDRLLPGTPGCHHGEVVAAPERHFGGMENLRNFAEAHSRCEVGKADGIRHIGSRSL